MAKKYAKFGIALASAALLGVAQILPATVPFIGATIVNADEGQPAIRYGINVYNVKDGVAKLAGSSGRLTSPPKPEDFFYSEDVENVVIEVDNNSSVENFIWYNVYVYWRKAPAPADPKPADPAPADPKPADPATPPVVNPTPPATNPGGGSAAAPAAPATGQTQAPATNTAAPATQAANTTTATPADTPAGTGGTTAVTSPAIDLSPVRDQILAQIDQSILTAEQKGSLAEKVAFATKTEELAAIKNELEKLTKTVPTATTDLSETRNQLLVQVDKSNLTDQQKGELAVKLSFAETTAELDKVKAELAQLTKATPAQPVTSAATKPATTDAKKTLPQTGDVANLALVGLGTSLVLASLGLARYRQD